MDARRSALSCSLPMCAIESHRSGLALGQVNRRSLKSRAGPSSIGCRRFPATGPSEKESTEKLQAGTHQPRRLSPTNRGQPICRQPPSDRRTAIRGDGSRRQRTRASTPVGSGPFASRLSYAKRLNKARRGSLFPMNGCSAGSRQTCARLPNPLSPRTSPRSPSAEAGTATASATAIVARSPYTAALPHETYLHDTAGPSGVVFRMSRAASIESWRRNIDPARGLRNVPRSDSDR